MYGSPIEKFSPSFWESEDGSQKERKGFKGIVPGVEHTPGRKALSIYALADFGEQVGSYIPPEMTRALSSY